MNKRIKYMTGLVLCILMAIGCAKADTGATQATQTEQATQAEQTTQTTQAEQTSETEHTPQAPQAEQTPQATAEQETYSYEEYPLERNGISLHLDCMKAENAEDKEPEKNILLVHGSTYSSHEFDINYEDYSLVRRLAREGYAVWRLDIAGYGQSEEVEDGLMPDTAYAAEDIRAAMERIADETGQDRIDLLGWSWGTMTTGLFASKYPEHLGKLVLYAPVFAGLGEAEITEPFNHNDWAGAAEDFQTREDGSFDPEVTDPVLIEMWCSSCWHYDGDSSPNAWRKDALVSEDTVLIDLEKITVPTLVICGDKDPYMDLDQVNASPVHLPEGSALKVIPGGSHILMYERNCYREFQDSVAAFLAEK